MNIIKKANEYFQKGDYINAYKLYLEAKKEYGFGFLDFNIQMCKNKIGNTHLKEVEKKLFEKKEVFSNLNECMIQLDEVHNGYISGWAIDKVQPNNTVVLETFIDGIPYSIIETYSLRKDVQNIYGGDGFYGFKGEVNKYLTFSDTSKFTVHPLNHKTESNFIKNASKPIQFLLKGKHFINPNTKSNKLVQNYLTEYSPIKDKSSLKISVIILNLNGSEVLFECLTSLTKWSPHIEIIVVDHGSTDNSIEIIKALENDNIVLINRDKNYSYSESNNLGANKASGDVLIFLNNDIVITSDSVSYMTKALEETEFGLLGIKLWDLPKSKNFKLDKDVKVKQHLGVQFSCVNRNETIEAFELRSSAFISLEKGILETPAATAAMIAIRKTEFLELGGFCEEYFYGQEDVDFCLRYQNKYDKKIGVVLSHGAYHIRGLSRKGLSKKNTSYINNNRKILQANLGAGFRKKARVENITKPGYWNHKPISVAMIVSEVSYETSKADFFTAVELGDAFEKDKNYTVGYFDATSDYDVAGYDIIIVFIDGFNPEILKNISPSCQLIAWARNWFDRWCERPWIEMYDIIYASSEYARSYMQQVLKREVKLLRIAASNRCINHQIKNSKYKSDYVFTGSYFNSPREITNALNPNQIPFTFKLYGYNWEQHEKFGKYTSGPIPYKDIPSVYANTNLVVDDANIATKKWGALNCRIYDALAAGTLCVTNNHMGIKELFDEDFPLYDSIDVNEKIINLLNDDNKRLALSSKYKKIVLEKHTYENRKDTIIDDVIKNLKKESISIKIAAPDFKRAVKWGDYYFAIEVRKELEKLGYKVRIDCLNHWNSERSLSDDINIVLRGLNEFKTREDQVNLIWLISHPDMLSEDELRKYDHVFIASQKYTNKLIEFLDIDNISYLPQASSFNKNELRQDILDATPSHEILFIGNSRNEYREVVKWCVKKNLPISIYGGGWESFVPKKYIKGTFISNEILPYYYRKARVVLNDHWEDMRRNGFISNRVFDVLAVGGTLITDYVIGIENIRAKNLHIYKDKKEFYTIVNKLVLENKKENLLMNPSKYSFKNRAEIINEIILQQVK